MKTYRCHLWTMKLVILVCQLGLILRTEAQIPDQCSASSTNRPPENEDITVVCGKEYMDLSIYLCPVYQALYNESLMVLNNATDNPECFGTADWNADPPVLRFRFDLNESSITSCGNSLKITDAIHHGHFSDFPQFRMCNISGTITSIDPSADMMTNPSPVRYQFFCLYPLPFLLSHKGSASDVSLAINNHHGVVTTPLRIDLYKDEWHKDILTIPDHGLRSKTRIYVAVTATSLTNRYNVLVDRCYISTTSYPGHGSASDIFRGCDRKRGVTVEVNGMSQQARFSFEVFGSEQHDDWEVSTVFLHCVTRICEASVCHELLPDCPHFHWLSKRDVLPVTDSITVTSRAIHVAPFIYNYGYDDYNILTYYEFYSLYSDSVFNGTPASSLRCCSISGIVFSIILAACFSI